MYKLAEKFAFQPPPATYKKYTFPYIDGKIPYHLNTKNPSGYTILYTHGNAEDLGQVRHHLDTLAECLNVNVIGYDYRGYGHNLGSSSEKACYEDIEIVYNFVHYSLGIPTDKIIFFGRSLGSGPTTHMAAKLCSYEKIGGVVLQSGFMSAVTVVTNKLWYLPFTDIFVNYSKIGKITAPVLLMHGKKDTVIPFEHSQKLAGKTKHLKKLILFDRAGHNDVETLYFERLIEELVIFISGLGQ